MPVLAILCNEIEDLPPFLIPAHWNIGILHYKQDKLRKYMQHTVYRLIKPIYNIILFFFPVLKISNLDQT